MMDKYENAKKQLLAIDLDKYETAEELLAEIFQLFAALKNEPQVTYII